MITCAHTVDKYVGMVDEYLDARRFLDNRVGPASERTYSGGRMLWGLGAW